MIIGVLYQGFNIRMGINVPLKVNQGTGAITTKVSSNIQSYNHNTENHYKVFFHLSEFLPKTVSTIWFR